MKLDSYDSSFSYTIHSPYELTTSETKFLNVNDMEEYVISFVVQETIANDKLRDLSISQRKCVFSDEENEGNKFRSYNTCVMRCRAARAFDKCHCIPHFYRFQNDGPVCTIQGLRCLAKYSDWYDKKYCHCLKPCTEIVYVAVHTSKNQWTSAKGIPFKQKSSLRWEVLQPKTRFRRDVLFGIEDLIVSFGGCISLFMGQDLFTVEFPEPAICPEPIAVTSSNANVPSAIPIQSSRQQIDIPFASSTLNAPGLNTTGREDLLTQEETVGGASVNIEGVALSTGIGKKWESVIGPIPRPASLGAVRRPTGPPQPGALSQPPSATTSLLLPNQYPQPIAKATGPVPDVTQYHYFQMRLDKIYRSRGASTL
ncbi:uncharacterized protein LOC128736109 [Sabethes cyaneus]|uniref:uncharacterized protein LOC128736109 n=1 Tax=Sabethes cyaneus TaxID=53552 RepID=UPI00237E6EAD|nr:uncharacterized protein LOC128736109 [Sabethes cyaneus]